MAIADTYFATSWGSIRLWCSNVRTDNSRTKIVHDLSSGDHHPVQDRGLAARRVTCGLLFDDIATETTTGISRFRAFKAAVDAGEAALFTHPIDGSYLAGVGSFTYEINDDGTITADVEFIAEGAIKAVAPAAAGTSATAAEGSIGQAADDLDSELAAVGSSSTATQAARDAADSWSSADAGPSSRDVGIATASISSDLATMITELGLEDDLALFGAYRAAIMFGEALRSGAAAATSESAAVFVIKIGASCSLLGLCVRIYGGADAEDRARQAATLNDIRRPGWLEPGRELVMPSRATSPRASL